MSALKPIATLVLALALVGGGLEAAQAQPPPPRQVVHPRSLITQVEIAEYRRAMKSAPTPEAKREIRDATYTRLRQRATERGMVMSEPNPWIPGMRWGASEAAHMEPHAP
jgi:hypothetical protein